jgi:hypothetical protein
MIAAGRRVIEENYYLGDGRYLHPDECFVRVFQAMIGAQELPETPKPESAR